MLEMVEYDSQLYQKEEVSASNSPLVDQKTEM